MVDSILDVTKVKDVTDFQDNTEEGEIDYDQSKNEKCKLKCFNLKNKQPPEIVVLDVGGRKFFVFASVFSTWPNSRLTRVMKATNLKEILELCDGYCPCFKSSEGKKEYFFDQNPENFNSILDIYRIGRLHRTKLTCALTYAKFLEYWGFDEFDLEPCCAIGYYAQKSSGDTEIQGENIALEQRQQQAKDEEFGNSCIGKIRTFFWNLMEYPEKSIFARIFEIASLCMVVISTITFILQTAPEFHADGEYPIMYNFLATTDFLAMIFFASEYFIRLLCCPRKLKFLTNSMNIVDLLAVLPFFITIIVHEMEDSKIIGKAGKMIRLVRVLRVMRIFKLVRHFAGMQAMLQTMKEAYRDLSLLAILVATQAFLFAILVFATEKDMGDQAWTLLDSALWSILTISTVGGGSKTPHSTIGRFLGGLCPIMGVTLSSLPIPIIVNSFADSYQNRVWRTDIRYKKEKLLLERKNGSLMQISEESLNTAKDREKVNIEMLEK